jgi:hypothetical protein
LCRRFCAKTFEGFATSCGVKRRPGANVRTVEAASTVSKPVSVAWIRYFIACSALQESSKRPGYS